MRGGKLATSERKTKVIDGAPSSPVPRCRIVSADLAALDALQLDALALLSFAAVAQPLGLAGLVDWRMSGRIARLVKSGRFSGGLGEALLTPSLGRIGVERIFLLGLGPPASLDDAGRARVTRTALETLSLAGARAVAVGAPVLPSRYGLSREDGVALVEAFVVGSATLAPGFSELVLLDVDGELVQARDSLGAAAKRAGLALEV